MVKETNSFIYYSL